MPAFIRKNFPALLLAMLVLMLGSCQTRQSLLMAMGWKEVPAQQKSRAGVPHASCSTPEFSQARINTGRQSLTLRPCLLEQRSIAFIAPLMPLAELLQPQRTGVQWPPLYLLYRQWKDEIAC